MRVLGLIVLIAVAVGCARTPSKHQPATSHALDEIQVLAIARAAVATNGAPLDRAHFEPPKQRPDGSWSVYVWWWPATPGRHAFISIDEQGRVTNYGRGL